MNERIRELCSQAISDVDGIQNPDTQNMYIPDCFAEKFAELIVKECAQYMYENYPHSRYEVDYMRKHMGDINWNKPFGVEL